MTPDLMALSGAALLIGFVHCICGPDHYIPFVAMSRVGVWSLRKTLLVTVVCGVGHVLGSAALGFIGIAAGVILFQLESVEQVRGDIAAWLLLTFGAVYMLWGISHARRGHHRHGFAFDSPHKSSSDVGKLPPESDGVGEGPQSPTPELGKRSERGGRREFTPWVLFLVFLFGPCEPLIPLLMYPAAQANVWSVIWVTTVFGITTLVTMVAVVALIYWGTFARRWHIMETYQHAVGGAVVMVCGGLILWQAS